MTKNRVLTGLIIFAIFVLVIILSLIVHFIFFDLFVLFLLIAGAFEVCKAVKNEYEEPFTIVVLATGVVGYIVFLIINLFDGTVLTGITAFLMIIAGAVLVSMVAYNFVKGKSIENALSTMFCLFYPCALMIFMIALNYLESPYRGIAIIMLFSAAPFTDIMAYLVGSTLKGKKLCPSISPKKTISGAIGGLFGGLLGGGLLILLTSVSIFNFLKIGGPIGNSTAANVINCLLLGLFGSVFTQLGDLLASFIKRKCGIKDFGNLLPGHGGVMDRIDGLILNAGFLFIYMAILNVIW